MCIFCKIVKGEIPNQTILEDENFLAFNDINPTRKIHVLISPKEHYASFDVTPPKVMSEMTEFIQKVSNVLGVNYNRSVVENFYHPYKAIFSDDVKRLSLKEVEGNEFLYLFINPGI